MVVQIALSLVLLVSTGLFVRTLSNLQRVDAGFNRRDLILFRIDATSAGYTRDQFAALQDRAAGAARARARRARRDVLQRRRCSRASARTSASSCPAITPPPDASMIVNTNGLAPNFFTAMQLPLVLGRGFTDARRRWRAARSRSSTRRSCGTYFDGENPVGHSIRHRRSASTTSVVIVGVAADAKYTDLRGPAPPTIYLPAPPAAGWRRELRGAHRIARRRRERERGDDVLGYATAVREIDPALPVLNLRTQDEQIDRLHAQQLLFARLSGLFGVFAIALACVGLYGLHLADGDEAHRRDRPAHGARRAHRRGCCEWFSANRSRSCAWGSPSARCRHMPQDASSPPCSSAFRPPIR